MADSDEEVPVVPDDNEEEEVLEETPVEEEAAVDGKKPKKKGVVFISRLPPGMKPQVLKQILNQYTDVLRLWCNNIDNESKKRQRKGGGALPEAWVELSSRKKAKRLADLLNCQPIGVGRFKSDLWTMKYLRGFQWQDLTNQLIHQRKVRDKRLAQRVEIAKKEANFFLNNREKQLEFERREKKRKRPTADDEGQEEQEQVVLRPEQIKRTFNQKTGGQEKKNEDEELDDDFFSSLIGSGPAPKRMKPN